MINGTKLLNTVLSRGRRDSILKSEQGKHIVRTGPINLQGIWIPFERAFKLAQNQDITAILYPLFVHNIVTLLDHPVNQRAQEFYTSSNYVKASGSRLSSCTSTKRSHLGCYTCRLRKKKCSEASSCCTTCKKLGLQCEYRRPTWWSDLYLRRAQRARYATIIKGTRPSKGMTFENPHDCLPPDHCSHSPTYDIRQQSGHDTTLLPPQHEDNARFESQTYVEDVRIGQYSPMSSFSTCYLHPLASDVIPMTEEQACEADMQLLFPPLV